MAESSILHDDSTQEGYNNASQHYNKFLMDLYEKGEITRKPVLKPKEIEEDYCTKELLDKFREYCYNYEKSNGDHFSVYSAAQVLSGACQLMKHCVPHDPMWIDYYNPTYGWYMEIRRKLIRSMCVRLMEAGEKIITTSPPLGKKSQMEITKKLYRRNNVAGIYGAIDTTVATVCVTRYYILHKHIKIKADLNNAYHSL